MGGFFVAPFKFLSRKKAGSPKGTGFMFTVS